MHQDTLNCNTLSSPSRLPIRSHSAATNATTTNETERLFSFARDATGQNIRSPTALSNGPSDKSPLRNTTRRSSDNDVDSFAPRGYSSGSLGSFRARMSDLARAIILSEAFSNLTTLLTIYALFGDDIRVAKTPFGTMTHRAVDDIFDACTITCLVIFSAEFLAFSAFQDDYFLGFFFWLDLVATASLVTDITTVNESMHGYSDSEDSAMTRAGRAGRVGTKAARMMRIIRLVRLVRIVKLYKSFVYRFSKKKEQEHDDSMWDDYPDEAMMSQSRVSKKLSDLTGKRVIMIVLGMLFCTPVFDYKTWHNDVPTSAQFGADWIHNLYKTSEIDAADAMAHYIQYHAPRLDKSWSHWAGAANIFYVGFHKSVSPWKSLPVADETREWVAWNPPFLDVNYTKQDLMNHWGPNTCKDSSYGMYPFGPDPSYPESACYTDQLRFSEFDKFLAVDLGSDNVTFFFVFDKREMTQVGALFNMFLTLFVCLVLGAAGLAFTRISNSMVLEPLERILNMMHAIRQNPMEAIFMGEEASETAAVTQWPGEGCLPTVQGRLIGFLAWTLSCFRSRKDEELLPSLTLLGGMASNTLKAADKEKKLPETLILEKTILKIGSLLVLGFGEAGAEIIGENLKESKCAGSNSQVAIVPGRKVEAAFGFCDIRNFTDVTEVLQDKVMVFVNQIAGIIHEVVDTFGGCPNKNIGDAFLLVWRFPQLADDRTQIANMALVCLVQIVAKIQSSKILAQYRTHAGILERLPNYQVRLGFGMHFGWAIEGAIGSAYKIDASYLSENVTMASRLEAATKNYDVMLLVSQSFVDHISADLHAELRLIDNVYFKGTRQPQKLYTLDIGPNAVYADPVDEFDAAAFSMAQSPQSIKRRKSFAAIKRPRRQRVKIAFDAYALFVSDPDLCAMRARYDKSNKTALSFRHRFHAAFFNYEAGEWRIAQQILKDIRGMLGYDDGPSRSMSSYLTTFNDIAPPNWPGYRYL